MKTSEEEREEILQAIFDSIDRLSSWGIYKKDYQRIIDYCQLATATLLASQE